MANLKELQPIANRVVEQTGRAGLNSLDEHDRVFFLAFGFAGVISNGGFASFFYNSPADQYSETLQALRQLGLSTFADLLVKEGVRPVQAIEKPPLLYNILYHNTKREPMLPLVEEARRLERENPKILAVSVPVGYQYADVPQMGPSVVVVTDGDVELAQKEAKRLAGLMWEHRHVMKLDLPDAPEAVRRAVAEKKTPVVLVEMGDNIGGGSAGDSTFLLRQLVDQKAQGYVSAIYDPEAVAAAVRAGIGGNFDLDVGGKTDQLHGEPVRIRGRVKLLYDGEYLEPAARHGGRRYLDQGLTAVIHVQGSTADLPNVVLLNSKRHTPFSLGQLTSAGIQPERQRILVVKAAVAFRAAYEPIAGTIIEVDTAGLTAVNPARFTYKRVRPGSLRFALIDRISGRAGTRPERRVHGFGRCTLRAGQVSRRRPSISVAEIVRPTEVVAAACFSG